MKKNEVRFWRQRGQGISAGAIYLATLALLFVTSGQAWALQVQPVPIPADPSTQPQLEVSGIGTGTANYGRTSNFGKPQAAINLSESSLMIGVTQKLYRGSGVGSFTLGGLTTEESNTGVGTSLFLHQAALSFQSQCLEATLGRTDSPTAHIVDFPTLRSDDLITLIKPLNPFSNGGNAEEHQYSNIASVTFNQGLTYYENIHAQHLIDSAGVGTTDGINSFGATFEYLGAPGMDPFGLFPSWGAGIEHIVATPGTSAINQLFAGGVLNLNQSTTHRWDFRVQDTLSLGSGLNSFQSLMDSYRANSNAIAAALRYLDSPFGVPGHQIALTLAYRSYPDVPHARSAGFALTGAQRLGQGFDLVAQYKSQWRDTALARSQSNGLAFEQVGEIGFVFNFGATFNQHIAPRRTLLNQEHQFLLN